MFGFFKKKTTSEPMEPETSVLSDAEKQKLQQLVAVAEVESEKLLAAAELDSEALARSYETLGLLQAELGEESAITTLEKSLSVKPSIGDGYKKLMMLYNQQRSAAAYQGDDEGIDKWMAKMDELRQIARNNTISY